MEKLMAQISFSLTMGSLRIRFPVAAKMALVIAGTIGEVAGSPVSIESDLLSIFDRLERIGLYPLYSLS